MSNKHTPGPWTLEKDGITLVMGSQIVATAIAPDGADNDEQRGNAAVLAASLEMLDVLKWLTQHDPDGDGGPPDYNELRHICERARSITAKATGGGT